MAMRDKSKSCPAAPSRGDIPAEVMARLQAAYQNPEFSSTQGCPDPEMVIGYALEELIPEQRAQVYAHLSECQDCLGLVLDLRSAWAEADGGEQKVRESTPIRVRAQAWLAGLAARVNGLFPRLVSFPRLIPVAGALVVLAVVGLGVFHHLKSPAGCQTPSTTANLKIGTTPVYRVSTAGKVHNVSSGAHMVARTTRVLPFLPYLLEN